MSAYVKKSWLMIFQFIYFGCNYQVSVLLVNNKRLCKGVWGILFTMENNYRFPLYTLQHLPRDIKKTLLQSYHGLTSKRSSQYVLIDVLTHFLMFFPLCHLLFFFYIIFIPVKLLNSSYMENITPGKHKLIYITCSSGNNSDA